MWLEFTGVSYGSSFVINMDKVLYFFEDSRGTVLTYESGDREVVQETKEQILKMIREYE